MPNRWGIHAPNFRPPHGYRRLDDFLNAGFQNYTVLHLNGDLIPPIRERYPNARILVRMYLQNWFTRDPADWAREIGEWANGQRQFNIELTWANEQNLDIEGHPHAASPSQFYPPASMYEDANKWNLEVIHRLRELTPWAKLHYPAFANGHSDDQNQAGYTGLEICRPSIQAADVMDCHVYWQVDTGPLQITDPIGGGQRFVITRKLFPDKPIFISECGNFAVQDGRSPEQYITWMRSLYHYDFILGATFFIWDSDDAPENARNIIQQSGGLLNALRDTPKDDPQSLPPVPAFDFGRPRTPPPTQPKPTPTPPKPTPAQPTPAQPLPVGGLDYIVLPGETLSVIAARFGTTVAILMTTNNITDARLLRAGQHLQILGASGQPAPAPAPAPSAPPAAPTTPTTPSAGENTYVVQSGDTLGAIAKRFNVSVQAIVAANNLPNANLIRPGQKLTIPEAQVMLSIFDMSEPPASPPPVKVKVVRRRYRHYITRKGDTLEGVATIFSVEVSVLATLDRVRTKGEFVPGTRLNIPRE